jgi:hypothetical protein
VLFLKTEVALKTALVFLLAFALTGSSIALQKPSSPTVPVYQPKFTGDKAHSDAEAAALGYMRTVVSAQRVYKKKHNSYAASLSALVGSGSFTRRMVDTKRGDYTVSFRPKGENYTLAMTPRQFDAEHRAFYVDESGVFRAEDGAPATASSPVLN